jgi:hypothetical protein
MPAHPPAVLAHVGCYIFNTQAPMSAVFAAMTDFDNYPL